MYVLCFGGIVTCRLSYCIYLIRSDRVRNPLGVVSPLLLHCLSPQRLKRRQGNSVRPQRLRETPRQGTPVMLFQVSRSQESPVASINDQNDPSLVFETTSLLRCFLRGVQHLQLLGREPRRWPVPGGPQLQPGLPPASQYTAAQHEPPAAQPAGHTSGPAAETAQQVSVAGLVCVRPTTSFPSLMDPSVGSN